MTSIPDSTPKSAYESDTLVSQYAEFHYGDPAFGVPNFAKAMADLAMAAHTAFGNGSESRALDLGCATGRSSFELARRFKQVVGVDFSAKLIQVGTRLLETGCVRYSMPDEGELVTFHERRLDSLGLAQFADRVEFWQGDACALKPSFNSFDLILAANLIDRLYSPRLFLQQVSQRLNPGGLLVLASPYTWLEDYTQRSEWIGGFIQNGEPVSTLDGLKQILSHDFTLVQGPQSVPFVIRETRRKHQHTVSEVTVWKRK